MTVKERLHQLVDELPEAEAVAAQRYLEYLRDCGLETLPTDDEPLTDDDLAEMNAAREELRRGQGRPWADVRRVGTGPGIVSGRPPALS